MAETVTVTPSQTRTVAVTSAVRSAAPSRTYLFGWAALAHVLAQRVVAASPLRWGVLYLPAAPARVVGGGMVSRRPLILDTVGHRMSDVALGARRSLVLAFSAGRTVVAGMLAWRPLAGSVAGSRVAAATTLRRSALTLPSASVRTVGVAPYTSVDIYPGTIEDSAGLPIADSSGGTLSGQWVIFTTTYLRRRILVLAPAVARVVGVAQVARRGLASAVHRASSVNFAGLFRRFLAVDFGPSLVRERMEARMAKWFAFTMPVIGTRSVDVAPITSVDTYPSTLEDSGGFNFTDSSGGTITAQYLSRVTNFLRRRALRLNMVDDPAGFVPDTVTAFSGDNVIDSSGSPVTSLIPYFATRVSAAGRRLSFLRQNAPGRTEFSATPFNYSPITDSLGNPVTDDASTQTYALI